jgi:hypothetical protein
LPSGASVDALVESLHNFGIWEVLAPGASGPSLKATSESSALLTLSDPLSDNFALSSTLASDISEAWSHEKLALSAVSDEVSDESVLHVPADSSGLAVLLPNSAVVASVSVSSLDLSACPGFSPVACGPLSKTALVLSALLTLSHPDSDDSSLIFLLGNASGELVSILAVLGADVGSLLPPLEDFGSLDGDLGLLDAASELGVSSLEQSAFLAISGKSLQWLILGAYGDASGPLVVALFENSAALAGSVLEFFDDGLSNRLAHFSGSLGRLPDNTAVSAIFISLHDLGVLHDVSPLAFGGVDGSTSADGALLEASLELADDFWLTNFLRSALGDASGPLLLTKLSGLAVSVFLFELFDKLSSLRNLSDRRRLASRGLEVAQLIGFADHISLLLGVDKSSKRLRVADAAQTFLSVDRQHSATHHAHDNRKISHF